MATTDYLPVAAAPGSNVVPQASFTGTQWQQTGFVTGVAQSAQANKVWRQASMMAAGWANAIIQVLGQNVPDDGNLNNLIGQLTQMLATSAQNVLNASGLAGRMTTAEGNISTLQGQYSSLSATVGNLTNQVNNLLQRMGAAEGNIGTLQGQVGTLQSQVGDLLNRMGSAEYNIGVLQGQTANLMPRMSNAEASINGLMPTPNPITSSMQNGWCRLPNGLIFQWGLAPKPQTVNFPISFQQACFGVTATTIYGTSTQVCQVLNVTKDGFSYAVQNNNTNPGYWFAVGV